MVLRCYNTKCKSFSRGVPDNCGHSFRFIRECEDAITESPRRTSTKPDQYTEWLMSEECYCGRSKKPKYPFCFNCYKSLPNDLKQGLWSKVGDGFEEAYEEAVEYLEREG